MNLITCARSKMELEVIGEFFEPVVITTYKISQPKEQSFNDGYFCCQRQIKFLKQQSLHEFDYLIALSSSINVVNCIHEHYYVKTYHIILESCDGNRYYGISFGMPIYKNKDGWKYNLTKKDQIRSAMRDCFKKIK